MTRSPTARYLIVLLSAFALLAQALPALAAPPDKSPAHENRARVTMAKLAKAINDLDEVSPESVSSVIENYESRRSWERDLDFTPTEEFASQPGEISYFVGEDGSVGL